ncbi:hypothetical protein GIB67_000634 [Kingdonia uniflora]|uniref:Protein kinase domain-containing protein n=1 Tax=Kingdonia uniflora TaxID=39325 RepID=A0A7J7NDG5_9MAGN|nr:hypothetical protein GIB67_000634 [Kingdonia uniflora]
MDVSQRASSSSTYYSALDSTASPNVMTTNENTKLREVAGLPREFGYEDLKKATRNFQHKLGCGGSGSVFKGVLKDGTLVAVKQVERKEYGERQFKAEITAIASVQHVHLFRYKATVDVAKALAYLHEDCNRKILHLDIKPENILLDENNHAVVSDFGLSRLMNKEEGEVHTISRGTPGYIAPEWFSGSEESDNLGISEKCDIFSYGVLLLDMLFGKRNVCFNVKGNRLNYYTYLSDIATFKKDNVLLKLIDKRLFEVGEVDIMEARLLLSTAIDCLEEDPTKRPDMRQVADDLDNRLLEIALNVFAHVTDPILSVLDFFN